MDIAPQDQSTRLAGVVSVRDMVLIGALAASTVLTVVLGVVDPVGLPMLTTKFLAWNLFLAWIPFVAAMGVARCNRMAAGFAGLVWIAFLPNAIYLVTDLVHLSDGPELWRHILQFGFAAWTGTLLAVVSLRMVHDRVERDLGRFVGWLVVMIAVAGSGVGVAIGRFQRWNSWDLITQPRLVAHSTLLWARTPRANIQPTGVAIAITLFFGLAYLTIWALSRPGFDGQGNTPG